MSSSEKETPSILGLPPEILELVTAHAVPEDLSSLRLTCRQFRITSLKAFSLRFRERRFIFSPYSLQGLLDISAHPVFGSRLEHISFGTCRLKNIVIPAKRPKRKKTNLIQQHNGRALEQQSFIQSGQALAILTQALIKIKKHRTEIKLGIFDDVHKCTKQTRPTNNTMGFGSRQLYEDLFANGLERCCSSNLRSLVSASELSGISLVHLTLELSCGVSNCEDPSGWGVAGVSAGLDQELSTIVQLSPGIFNPGLTVDIHIGREKYLRMDLINRRLVLRKWVENSDLQGLYLPLFDDLDLGALGKALRFGFFREIYLADIELPWYEFVELISPQGRTLRALTMSNVSLTTYPWNACFWTTLRDRLRLEHMISAFVRSRERDDKEEMYITDKREWHGEEEVRAGIRRMADGR